MDGDPVIRLMGPVAILDSGRTVEITSGRQRRLLAALAVHAPDVVSVDRLVDIVWGGEPPESAPRTLQSYVSRLRSRLIGARSAGEDEVLERAEPGYSLAASITSDASSFETLAAAAHDALRRGGFASASSTLERALGLWRGEPIAEFADEDWARPYARRLAERRVTALEDLAECELGRGDPSGAIVRLEELVAEHPLRERPRALLMRALFAAGRQTEALRAYREFYSLLAEEVGLGPSPELVQLEAQIATGTLAVDESARSAAVGPTRNGLPVGTVTFLFTDVEDSTRLWENHRDDMELALKRHDAIVRGAIESHGGVVFSTAGDAFAAAFQDHDQAAAAAIDALQTLAREPWPDAAPIRVRMGLHTGNADERDGDYFGPTLNLGARVMSAGHGGQLLVTAATNELLSDVNTCSLGAHRLKGLSSAQEIFEVMHGDVSTTFPPIRTLDVVAHNLPIVDDDLLGRTDELAEIAGLLSDHRLVTIVGVGGIGKTRLALEVAAQQVEAYADGVWLFELASVGEPTAVAESVAQTLGTRQHPGRSLVESIAEFCRRRQMLLVLDNCEHVLDAAADLVEAVFAVAPDVHILATSREGLGSNAELTYPLRSLDTSGDDSASSDLFVRRAAEAVPGREWSDTEHAAIARICSRLDGIPLAIELAATRTGTQKPVEIEERLDDAFRSLRGGRRSIERHRTLQAAIDWSYAALSPHEQTLFRRLAVFSGTCDLDAIEAICAGAPLDRSHVLDLVEDLVSKSLVVADPGPGPRTRFRLLEPLRQFAEDRLAATGETETVRDAHAEHYAEWAGWWNDALYGPERDLHVSLDLEFANARAAFFWALDRDDLDRPCRIVAGLLQAQEAWRRLEVGGWAARILDLPAAMRQPLGPRVALIAGVGCWWRNDLRAWDRYVTLAESMDHYDTATYGHAQIRATHANLRRGDPEAARALLAGVESRTIEERFYEAWHTVQFDIGSPASFDAAETIVRLAAETGSELLQIGADAVNGLVQLFDDRDEAAASSRRAIEAAESIGARFWVHHSLGYLGMATAGSDEVRLGDLARMRDGLRAQRGAGDETDQWLILVGAAIALHPLIGPQLASEVHRGLQSSQWSSSPLAGAIEFSVPEVAAAAGTDDIVVADLVDRVIETIDALLDEQAKQG